MVYDQVVTIMLGVDELRLAVAGLQESMTGVLSVGAGPTVGTFVVTQAIAALRDRHPGVDVRLVIGSRRRLLDGLASREFDGAVVPGPADSRFSSRPFDSSTLVVFAAPDHPLAGQTAVPRARLAAETLILRELGAWVREAVEHVFAASEAPIRHAMEIPYHDAIKEAVANRLGVGALSRAAIRAELRAERLVILDVERFPLPAPTYLYWQNDPANQLAAAFTTALFSHPAAPDAAGRTRAGSRRV